MELVHYEIIEATTVPMLQKQVKEAIAQGWVVLGGLSVVQVKPGVLHYYQAIGM